MRLPHAHRGASARSTQANGVLDFHLSHPPARSDCGGHRGSDFMVAQDQYFHGRSKRSLGGPRTFPPSQRGIFSDRIHRGTRTPQNAQVHSRNIGRVSETAFKSRTRKIISEPPQVAHIFMPIPVRESRLVSLPVICIRHAYIYNQFRGQGQGWGFLLR